MTRRFARFGDFRKRGIVAVLLCSAGLGAMAQAQSSDEGESRLRLAFGIETGDETQAFTQADLLVQRATRTQQLTFGVNTRLLTIDEDGTEFGFDAPNVTLSYANQSGPVNFDLGYTYVKGDVDGLQSLESEADSLTEESFVTATTGTRIRQTGRVGIEIGERDPFGATLRLSYSDVAYEDTTDPRVYDATDKNAALNLRFDVSQVLRLTAGMQYGAQESQDALNTAQERLRYSIGAEAQVNRVMTVDAALNWNTLETTRDNAAGERVVSTQDGAGFVLGVTIDQRNGSSRFGYRRSLEADGTDDRLTYSRNLDLTEVQSLSYSIGVVRKDDTFAPIGNIAYEQQLRNGLIQLRASQGADVTDLGNRAVTRQLSGSYTTSLTSRSDVTFTASLAALDYDDAALSDVRTTTAGITYRHELTRDWDVRASAEYALSKDGDTEDEDTGLSLTVNRNFSLFR